MDRVACRPLAGERHAAVGVARDEIDAARFRRTDEVAGRVGQAHAVETVAQTRETEPARADEISREDVVARARADEGHAAVGVSGNHVARQRCDAADEMAGRLDAHAAVAVAAAQHSGPVRADPVARHGVARAAGEEHAVLRIAGNHVARARRRTADDIARAARHVHAAEPVAQHVRACHVEAETVSRHHVRHRVRVDNHPAVAIAGDEVAREQVGSADDIVMAERESHAGVAVAEIRAAGDIGADEISLDAVVVKLVRGGGEEINAALAIGGNDIARAGRRAADEIVSGAKNRHPVRAVAASGRAAAGRANEISGHPVVAGSGVAQIHPALAVAGNDIARARLRAADDVAGRANEHTVVGVAKTDRAVHVGADEISQDHIARRAEAADPQAGLVAGKEVAIHRISAADAVVSPVQNRDAGHRVHELRGAAGRGADEAARDHVVLPALDLHAAAVETINEKRAHRGVAGEEVEAGHRACAGANESDEGQARVARLGGAVDRHGISNIRQPSQRRDGEGRSARKIESDEVRAGRGIRIQHRLAQGARAAVTRAGHGKFCRLRAKP